MRVAVVGAGAVGLTAAHDLASGGADVTVYERDDVGGGATGRAAGIAYDAFEEATDVRLARRALDRFRAWSGEGGFRFHATPYLWFVTDAAEAAAVREQVSRLRDHGVDCAFVDADRVRTRFPQLRTGDVAAAAITEGGGCLDPRAYVDLLATRARTAGAEVRTGAPAAVHLDPPRVAVENRRETYDAVLVAAGADTGAVCERAGVDVPLGAYRTQALRTSGPAIPLLYDATAGFYARPHQRGIVAGARAARADPSDWSETADDDFESWMVDRLAERLVNLETSPERSWAGLCTATPDGDPLLGPVADGLYVAAGWHGSGLMRAPATGEAVAEQILGTGDGVARFDPGRFDGDEPVAYP